LPGSSSKVAIVVVIVAIALAAISLLPGSKGPGTARTSTAIVVANTSGATGGDTASSQSSSLASNSTCGLSSETYGNITLRSNPCVSYSFPSGQVAYATLESQPAHAFVKGAYDYQLAYFGTSLTNPDVTYAVLNVTGTQEVTGNWTGGYQVSYVNDRLLNVTLVHAQASTYYVSHLSDYQLSDRNVSITFTPQEQRAIEVALSDRSVKALLAQSRYYVASVTPFSNGTIEDSYLVQLYQVDGVGSVGVVVNPGLTAVLSSYASQRVTSECWPDGFFIADPWSAVSSTACEAESTATPTPP
jgi:hypothetical protein